ncbi:hypothetical protein BZL31_19015 [Escherichia coli]|uniref:hypothetical protein n=1 Tax=Escherichia coli TaxID=562 RepID=UPI000A385A31|nr:hypothetical protein [Escherichia coli]OUK49004.1 hypothetical protein BZL31_19015 [Escherichia coli]
MQLDHETTETTRSLGSKSNAEVMRRDGIELNGVDMRNIRTRVLELLAYRRRSQQRRESAKNTYQWKKPERLRR